jgi:hypothetical protein
VQQKLGPLDVSQKLESKTGSPMRPFYQAWYIGDHKMFVIAQINHAEIGRECGEGIIGYLRLGRRYARYQSRFPHIVKPNETHVGKEFQFKLQEACFSRPSRFVMARGPVYGSGETGIAAPPAPTFGYQDSLVDLDQIRNHLAGLAVCHKRPDRHFDDYVFTVVASTVAALPMPATLGLILGIISKREKRVHLIGGKEIDIAASPAVAPGRAAARHKFLAAEGHAAVSAVATFYEDSCSIDEHI